jgi:lactate dehydrogenase-like 2-hydroxyacid dehydrogenase
VTPWRALVTNGTFREVLATHRARMEAAGLEVIETGEDTINLPVEQVYALGQHADVIFGPSGGLDAKLFEIATCLKVVAIAASGYESVNLEAATRAGVVVTNAPVQAGSEAVADMAWGLMLAVARAIPQRHMLLMQQRQRDRTMGLGLWGKTLGIVGLGTIGRLTARRAQGFEMTVLACNRSWTVEHESFATRYGIRRVDLDTLLRESDVVSLHLRGTPETRHIIDARELDLLKPTAILVNTARTHLVDQQALYQALAQGKLAGAGLDTIADEGLDSPLMELPNVVGTPHLGNRCVDSVHEVMDAAIDNALAVLRGKRPAYLVNPDVYIQPTLKEKK